MGRRWGRTGTWVGGWELWGGDAPSPPLGAPSRHGGRQGLTPGGLSVCAGIRAPLCPALQASVCPAIPLSLRPATRALTCPSVRPSLHLCTHPPTCLSVCPSLYDLVSVPLRPHPRPLAAPPVLPLVPQRGPRRPGWAGGRGRGDEWEVTGTNGWWQRQARFRPCPQPRPLPAPAAGSGTERPFQPPPAFGPRHGFRHGCDRAACRGRGDTRDAVAPWGGLLGARCPCVAPWGVSSEPGVPARGCGWHRPSCPTSPSGKRPRRGDGGTRDTGDTRDTDLPCPA